MSALAERVIALLDSCRFSIDNEDEFQAAISRVLTEANIANDREQWISAKDRIDILLRDEPIGIEVKIKGSHGAVRSQIMRYAASDKLSELIVVTTRMNFFCDPEIYGKPVHVVSIWKNSF